MLGFLVRRFFNALGVLWLVVTGLFFTLRLAPGSPVNSLPPAVQADPIARAAYAKAHGLDENIFVAYVKYLAGILSGDFGHSLYDGTSVLSQVSSHLPVSMELGALAAIGAMVPGFVIGCWTATQAGTWRDTATQVLTVLSISVPAYWLAVLALVLAGQHAPDMLPSGGGFVRFFDDPVANLTVMFLPALVLGLSTFALVVRSLRAALVDVLQNDYVSFARAMGMSRFDVLRRIGVRNAIIPALTVIGVLLGSLISGTVLVESVFQVPGLGQLMVTAFLRQDYELALGSAIFTAVIFLGLNLVVDLLYYVVDPRMRATLSAPRTVRTLEAA